MSTHKTKSDQLLRQLHRQLGVYRGAINAVATESGYTRQHASKILNGDYAPTAKFLAACARVLERYKRKELQELGRIEATLAMPAPTTQAAA